MRFLRDETAAYFGIAIDELIRKPVEWRAEMMAHILLKDARDGYMEHLKEKSIEAKKKAKTHYNPADRQMRKWMTG